MCDEQVQQKTAPCVYVRMCIRAFCVIRTMSLSLACSVNQTVIGVM